MSQRVARAVLARLAHRLQRAADRLVRLAEPRGRVATPPSRGAAPDPERASVRGLGLAEARSPLEIDWFHSVDLGDGEVTKGVKSVEDLEREFAALQLNRALLAGRTVLDVGTADGWNALRCEALGASVTAVDGIYREGLRYVRSRLKPRFRFVQLDINGPSFLELGQFDVVLYLGVLYHTPYPYEQLVRVASCCRDVLLLESAYLNLPGAEDEPTLTFNFDGHITPDLSSPVFPSTVWIRQGLARVGFRKVELLQGGEGRLGRVLFRARERDPSASPLLYAAEQVHV
jgi:tRNA (mo5U34)-methyltransferase